MEGRGASVEHVNGLDKSCGMQIASVSSVSVRAAYIYPVDSREASVSSGVCACGKVLVAAQRHTRQQWTADMYIYLM